MFVPRRQMGRSGLPGAFVICTVCGCSGMPGGRWQENCIRNPEHPFRCSCGRRFPSVGALAAHIRAEAQYRPKAIHMKDIQ